MSDFSYRLIIFPYGQNVIASGTEWSVAISLQSKLTP